MKNELEAIQILERIFGTQDKVKIMRMFLFNQNLAFDIEDIVSRTKIKKDKVRKEITNLEKAGLLSTKKWTKDVIKKRGKTETIVKKKTQGWIVNTKFAYLIPLQNFLVHINPLKHNDIMKKLTNVGKIKLLIISGIFIQEYESRVDLLIVGDGLSAGKVSAVVREIESEIGKELRYSLFATDDFEYRYGMMDKLVRDILDFPHEKIVDKLDIH